MYIQLAKQTTIFSILRLILSSKANNYYMIFIYLKDGHTNVIQINLKVSRIEI
jgi:hypothetical protein